MEAIMEETTYTREDLIALGEMADPDSAVAIELEDMDYDPEKFKEYMKPLSKQYRFIYQTSLDDALMNNTNDPKLQRFFMWRMSINK